MARQLQVPRQSAAITASFSANEHGWFLAPIICGGLAGQAVSVLVLRTKYNALDNAVDALRLDFNLFEFLRPVFRITHPLSSVIGRRGLEDATKKRAKARGWAHPICGARQEATDEPEPRRWSHRDLSSRGSLWLPYKSVSASCRASECLVHLPSGSEQNLASTSYECIQRQRQAPIPSAIRNKSLVTRPCPTTDTSAMNQQSREWCLLAGPFGGQLWDVCTSKSAPEGPRQQVSHYRLPVGADSISRDGMVGGHGTDSPDFPQDSPSSHFAVYPVHRFPGLPSPNSLLRSPSSW